MRVLVLISILDATSYMQDFSQLAVVVADHISHSSSSQCCPHHLNCLMCQGKEKSVKLTGINIITRLHVIVVHKSYLSFVHKYISL